MKKIFLFAVPVFMSFFLSIFLFVDNQPIAGGGCCKQRPNISSPHWYENGLNFRQCRDLNRQRDNDDVYRRSGTIWWDENC